MIDFDQYFHKTQIERLSFQTRKQNGNYGHDIIFLSSYLHDATFLRRDLVLKAGVIELEVNRDCWELYKLNSTTTNWLPGCRSRLRFSDVFRLKLPGSTPKEFMIGSVFIGSKSYRRDDYCELIIISQCLNFEIVIKAREDTIPVTLEDLEDPK